MKTKIKDFSKIGRWLLLGLQHVFAMFSATVLVPLLTGLDVGVALVASGVGTLIYIVCTKGKAPMYLGSSFAYIGAIVAAKALGGLESAFVGLIVVGIIYIIVALILTKTGSGWLKKLLPPVIVGPMIIVIGMSLAPTAISSAGLDGNADYTIRQINTIELETADYGVLEEGLKVIYYEEGKVFVMEVEKEGETLTYSEVAKYEGTEILYAYNGVPLETNAEKAIFTLKDGNYTLVKNKGKWIVPLIALLTFAIVVILSTWAKGFLKIVPFLIAIIVGYGFACIFGIVDYSFFSEVSFFQLPAFKFIGTYKLNFSAIAMFAPLAFVTIAEHIGDHNLLSEVMGKDLITDPGLHRTLLGDGVATLFAGAIGGPANTSYGENIGVVTMTGVTSAWVTGIAAVMAILLGFLGYLQAFVMSIPWAIIGGMTIVLYGLIASSGVRILVKNKINLSVNRNLLIVSTMLVIGLGGAIISFGNFSMVGMSLAMVVGVILNLVLPEEKKRV